MSSHALGESTDQSNSSPKFRRRVSPRRPRDSAERRALGLGVFSLGLGLAQVLAPRRVARFIGVSDGPVALGTMRALGAREIAAGLGILGQPRPNIALWARVAGDCVDLAMLLSQLAVMPRNRRRLAVATAAVVGATVLDTKAALDATRARRGQDLDAPGIHVEHSITIRATPAEVYAFWRDLENLPKFMSHLESVEVRDGKSYWRAKAPAGVSVEWEAETTADHPDTLIAWKSLPGSTIPNVGSVRFRPAPGNRGTEVQVELIYEAPGGALGAMIAKMFGEEPKQQIKSDLRRLKQVLETGEVLHSDSSIHRGTHAAQPSEKTSGIPEAPIYAVMGNAHTATQSFNQAQETETTR